MDLYDFYLSTLLVGLGSGDKEAWTISKFLTIPFFKDMLRDAFKPGVELFS
jgi:hypothetical protein